MKPSFVAACCAILAFIIHPQSYFPPCDGRAKAGQPARGKWRAGKVPCGCAAGLPLARMVNSTTARLCRAPSSVFPSDPVLGRLPLPGRRVAAGDRRRKREGTLQLDDLLHVVLVYDLDAQEAGAVLGRTDLARPVNEVVK